jgi:hypothetical protein
MALEDCEDAYGFPPYREMEPFLTTWNGQDLRPIERRIIGGALATCPTRLIRREGRDWWARVIELYVAGVVGRGGGPGTAETLDVRATVAGA